MANLFDNLKFGAASTSLTEKRNSQDSGSGSGSSGPGSSIHGVPVIKRDAISKTIFKTSTTVAGTTCQATEESHSSSQTARKEPSLETSISTAVVPKLKKIHSKAILHKSEKHEKTVAKQKADVEYVPKNIKVPSKKVKIKRTTDMPSAPPKKVARRSENIKKQKTFASRPPDLKKEPKPKPTKKSKKLVDLRPAFEPLTKPFVIPRKSSKDIGLLEEVTLDSREYLKDIQPLVLKQYREVASRGRFLFTKAKIVNNEELAREFLERKKVLKEDGRNEKDVEEHYAFYCVDTEKEAIKICQDGIHAQGGPTHCLGNSEMGVYLSRYSDIIKRGPMTNGQKGFLVVFKIMRGKVKAMALNYTSVIEPTPNFDCHVSKETDIDVLKLGPKRAFDHTQIYIYEYGELDLEKRPKQICPYAVIQFVYKDPKKQAEREPLASVGTVSQWSPAVPTSPSPSSTPSSTPTRQATQETLPVLQTVDAKDYKMHCKHCYRLWKGSLICKGHKVFTGIIVSYSSPIVPPKLPDKIDLRVEVPLQKLKDILPSPIFKQTLPIIAKQKEVMIQSSSFMYTEMKQLKEKDEEENSRKYRNRSLDSLIKYLLLNGMALKLQIDSKSTVYLLPTSAYTDELGMTAPGYPIVLHVLFVSQAPVITQVSGKGIHLPKDFKHESAIDKLTQDNPNRLRDIRRTMLGFFAEQKSIAMGESQKQCRVEMQPEYRTSQSVYSSNYTAPAGLNLSIPPTTGRARMPSGDNLDPSAMSYRQHHRGYPNMVPASPQSESGSSQHSTSASTSPLYEPPDVPHSTIDPRLKAHAAKRQTESRLAVAYTSTSQVDPRLARSMGAKAPTRVAVGSVLTAMTESQRDDVAAKSSMVRSESKGARYSELQESAMEYALRRAPEEQKKLGDDQQKKPFKKLKGNSAVQLHDSDRSRHRSQDQKAKQKREKRKGSERGLETEGFVKHAKRHRHMSEPDQKEQALLKLTQKTLNQLKTDLSNPVLRGSSQLHEFRGMLKQQQQVLDLQKEMKQLRETRRNSAEGLVKASPGDIEGAYQSKIAELQNTLKSLLQQRQRLTSTEEDSVAKPSHKPAAHESTVSDLLTEVSKLDPGIRAPSDSRQAIIPDTQKLSTSKPTNSSQISDAESNQGASYSKTPYEVVMEIESPDPDEQMASMASEIKMGSETSTNNVPFEKPATDTSNGFGAALAVMDTVKEKKIKKKQVSSAEKSQGEENTSAADSPLDTAPDAAPDTALDTVQEESEVGPHQKSAVQLLWDKTQEESMTDASDDLVIPHESSSTVPDNKSVSAVIEEAEEKTLSPIRGANEMKDFLNSTVETPGRTVSDEPNVADKAKSLAEKKKIKSANDMKSYLNKQLQELEKEKKERGKHKKGMTGNDDDDPQTIEEIDALIRKLHKLKHAKLKAEQQQKQKKKSSSGKTNPSSTKVAKSKDDAKENIVAKCRNPVYGEAPLTRHWGRGASTVYGIILGPGPNRTIRLLSPMKQQKEDERKVKMTIDGKKISVNVIVSEGGKARDSMDQSVESCVMYILHHRFTADSEVGTTDEAAYVDSVLEAVYSMISMQQVLGTKERQRQVVETSIKLEKRKQLSEERMSHEFEETGELASEDLFVDLDDAGGVSIKLGEKGGIENRPPSADDGSKKSSKEDEQDKNKANKANDEGLQDVFKTSNKTGSRKKAFKAKTAEKTIQGEDIPTPKKAELLRHKTFTITVLNNVNVLEKPKSNQCANSFDFSDEIFGQSPVNKSWRNSKKIRKLKLKKGKLKEMHEIAKFKDAEAGGDSKLKLCSDESKRKTNKRKDCKSAKKCKGDGHLQRKPFNESAQKNVSKNSAQNKDVTDKKKQDCTNNKSMKNESSRQYNSLKNFKIPKKSAQNKDTHSLNANATDVKKQVESPKDCTIQSDTLKSITFPNWSSPHQDAHLLNANDNNTLKQVPSHIISPSDSTRKCDSLKSFKIPKKSVQHKDTHLHNITDKSTKLPDVIDQKNTKQSSAQCDSLNIVDIPKTSAEDKDLPSCEETDKSTTPADTVLNKNTDHRESQPKMSGVKENVAVQNVVLKQSSKKNAKALMIEELKEAIKSLDRKIEINRALKRLTESAKVKDLKGMSEKKLNEIAAMSTDHDIIAKLDTTTNTPKSLKDEKSDKDSDHHTKDVYNNSSHFQVKEMALSSEVGFKLEQTVMKVCETPACFSAIARAKVPMADSVKHTEVDGQNAQILKDVIAEADIAKLATVTQITAVPLTPLYQSEISMSPAHSNTDFNISVGSSPVLSASSSAHEKTGFMVPKKSLFDLITPVEPETNKILPIKSSFRIAVDQGFGTVTDSTVSNLPSNQNQNSISSSIMPTTDSILTPDSHVESNKDTHTIKTVKVIISDDATVDINPNDSFVDQTNNSANCPCAENTAALTYKEGQCIDLQSLTTIVSMQRVAVADDTPGQISQKSVSDKTTSLFHALINTDKNVATVSSDKGTGSDISVKATTNVDPVLDRAKQPPRKSLCESIDSKLALSKTQTGALTDSKVTASTLTKPTMPFNTTELQSHMNNSHEIEKQSPVDMRTLFKTSTKASQKMTTVFKSPAQSPINPATDHITLLSLGDMTSTPRKISGTCNGNETTPLHSLLPNVIANGRQIQSPEAIAKLFKTAENASQSMAIAFKGQTQSPVTTTTVHTTPHSSCDINKTDYPANASTSVLTPLLNTDQKQSSGNINTLFKTAANASQSMVIAFKCPTRSPVTATKYHTTSCSPCDISTTDCPDNASTSVLTPLLNSDQKQASGNMNTLFKTAANASQSMAIVFKGLPQFPINMATDHTTLLSPCNIKTTDSHNACTSLQNTDHKQSIGETNKLFKMATKDHFDSVTLLQEPTSSQSTATVVNIHNSTGDLATIATACNSSAQVTVYHTEKTTQNDTNSAVNDDTVSIKRETASKSHINISKVRSNMDSGTNSVTPVFEVPTNSSPHIDTNFNILLGSSPNLDPVLPAKDEITYKLPIKPLCDVITPAETLAKSISKVKDENLKSERPKQQLSDLSAHFKMVVDRSTVCNTPTEDLSITDKNYVTESSKHPVGEIGTQFKMTPKAFEEKTKNFKFSAMGDSTMHVVCNKRTPSLENTASRLNVSTELPSGLSAVANVHINSSSCNSNDDKASTDTTASLLKKSMHMSTTNKVKGKSSKKFKRTTEPKFNKYTCAMQNDSQSIKFKLFKSPPKVSRVDISNEPLLPIHSEELYVGQNVNDNSEAFEFVGYPEKCIHLPHTKEVAGFKQNLISVKDTAEDTSQEKTLKTSKCIVMDLNKHDDITALYKHDLTPDKFKEHISETVESAREILVCGETLKVDDSVSPNVPAAQTTVMGSLSKTDPPVGHVKNDCAINSQTEKSQCPSKPSPNTCIMSTSQRSPLHAQQADGISTQATTSSLSFDWLNLDTKGTFEDIPSASSNILDSDSEIMAQDELKIITSAQVVKSNNSPLETIVANNSNKNGKNDCNQSAEWVVLESISDIESEVACDTSDEIEMALKKEYPETPNSLVQYEDTSGDDTCNETDKTNEFEVTNLEWMETLPGEDSTPDGSEKNYSRKVAADHKSVIEEAVHKHEENNSVTKSKLKGVISKQKELKFATLNNKSVSIGSRKKAVSSKTCLKSTECSVRETGKNEPIAIDATSRILSRATVKEMSKSSAVTNVDSNSSARTTAWRKTVDSICAAGNKKGHRNVTNRKKDLKSFVSSKVLTNSTTSTKKGKVKHSSVVKTLGSKIIKNKTVKSSSSKTKITGTAQAKKKTFTKEISTECYKKLGVKVPNASQKTVPKHIHKTSDIKQRKDSGTCKSAVTSRHETSISKTSLTKPAQTSYLKDSTIANMKKVKTRAKKDVESGTSYNTKITTTSEKVCNKHVGKANSNDCSKNKTNSNIQHTRSNQTSTCQDSITSNKEHAKGPGGKVIDKRVKSHVALSCHPYNKRGRSSKNLAFSQYLVIPELHELMRNYTSSAYVKRSQNRLTVAAENFFKTARTEPGRFKDMGETICSGIAVKLNEKKYNTNVQRSCAQQRHSRVKALEERLKKLPARRSISCNEYNRDSEYYGQGSGHIRRHTRPEDHQLAVPDHRFRRREQAAIDEHQYQIHMQQVQQHDEQHTMQLQQFRLQQLQQEQHSRMQYMQQRLQQNMYQFAPGNHASQWWGNDRAQLQPGPWRTGM